MVAIGPRFVYRYITSAYYPLDSDIVREMQVFGYGRDVAEAHLEEDDDLRLVVSPPPTAFARELELGESTQSDGPDLIRMSPPSSQGDLHSPTAIPSINVHGVSGESSPLDESWQYVAMGDSSGRGAEMMEEMWRKEHANQAYAS